MITEKIRPVVEAVCVIELSLRSKLHELAADLYGEFVLAR